VQKEEATGPGCPQARGAADQQRHRAGPPRRPTHNRHAHRSLELPVVDGLDIRGEHGDQIFGLHPSFSNAIEAARARSPRCTLTLTADSDMRHRRAASATLKPSSFTHSIACRILYGKRHNSLWRSYALSAPT